MTLGDFLSVVDIHPKNNGSGVFVTIVGIKSKNVVEKFLRKAPVPEMIEKTFTPNAQITKIVFLNFNMQIWVDE